MNQRAFQARLTLLSEATNRVLSPELIRLWWEKYGRLPDAVLDAAFERALDTCKFFPSIAEFNGVLDELRIATGSAPAPGEDAWAAFLARLRRWEPDLGVVRDGTRGLIRKGDTGSGLYDGLDPLTKPVIDGLGGARAILERDERDLTFTRKDFIAHYDNLLRRRAFAAQLATLIQGIDAAEKRSVAPGRAEPGETIDDTYEGISAPLRALQNVSDREERSGE